MNLIQVAGRLGNDPEERFTPGGQKVVSFRMAVNSRKKGEEITTWYRITIWGDRFDRMMPYVKKGSALIVVGELQKPEIYNDRNGQPQVSLDITAEIIKFSPFGKGNSEQQPQATPAMAGAPAAAPAAAAPAPAATNFDDDLPF